MRRVFVDWIADGEAAVSGSAARHLASVARLRRGERVEVSDQRRAYRATVDAVSSSEVRFRLVGCLEPAAEVPGLDAALAVIRFRRFEWAVEKLTELGVRRITPVIARRSDPKLSQAAAKRVDRWRRIAVGAAQQARRLKAPAIDPPTGFAQFVRGTTPDCKVILDPRGPPVRALPGGACRFLVGPEGGWASDEFRRAAGHGFEAAGLGPAILRTETAAVAMAAIRVCGGWTGRRDA